MNTVRVLTESAVISAVSLLAGKRLRSYCDPCDGFDMNTGRLDVLA